MKIPRGIVAVTLILIFGLSLPPSQERGLAQVVGAQEPPNIVLILTDDQPAHTLAKMPKTRELLGSSGTTFEKAYFADPLCCPSRATLLKGQYNHNHGIVGNSAPRGGARVFRERGLDRDTIATRLSGAGYEAAYFGKYMNEYGEAMYVPPGWKRWFVLTGEGSQDDDRYGVSDQGRRVSYSVRSNETDLIRDKAAQWIKERGEVPFFAVLAPRAPHGPYDPPARHRNDFNNARWRPPSFDEDNISDKTWHKKRLTGDEKDMFDAAYEGKLEELQAVDDLVGATVAALRETGELENTYVFYTTDNGYLLGEHRLEAKGQPYDPSLKMPLLVRVPGVAEDATSSKVVSNVDLAPTFAELAGLPSGDYDGRPLTPLLSGGVPEVWREAVLSEHSGARAWEAVTTERYRYIKWGDGDEELYDLEQDPQQLENVLAPGAPSDPEHASVLDRLRDRLGALRTCEGEGCRMAETS